MSLRKIVRVAAKAVAAIIGVLVALLLVWIGSNLFDQPLSASARTILATPPDPYPDDDNVFIALVGFDAPAGQSMIRAGEQRMEEIRRMRARTLAQENTAAGIAEPAPRAPNLEYQGALDASRSVWSGAKDHYAEISALIDSNRELYQRYLSLHGLHAYFEAGGPIDPAPGLIATRALQRLYLAKVANSIQTGDPSRQQTATIALEQDLQLWRTVLDGTGGMLSKMVAAGALQQDMLLAGDMVIDPGCDLAFLHDRADSLLAPFSLQNWQIGSAYDTEMRWRARSLAAIPRVMSDAPWSQRADNWLGLQLFKLQATENLDAQRTLRLRALADGDPATYFERRAAYDAWVRHSLPRHFPIGFYNPVGKTLIAISALNESFPPRAYDVAALQRLVFLAYQIRELRVPCAAVPQFMAQHPQWSIHPMNGRPFRWDPASGRLAVATLGHEPPQQRFALTLHECTSPRT